ncbi:Venom protease [Amphibalanus amphitrite]|uniref:Venom protease n=1 Tax=Amphibalanus amphitrite TaxID=1232801 RepID=A0A6A4WU11_AMPAM|nr:venom protease-like isoform X1 [Amphibalanus amphitrite]XP_043217104.1 venom protease-like isoform X1 [Amphibalanus amphitrite]KAF0307120.1 Venom protease [Amphibalanus amphitrite]
MSLWWIYLALLAFAASISGALTFPQQDARCHQSDQQCISILSCPQFQTRADVLRFRPRPCGFIGTTALVCCSVARTGGLTGTRSPLPISCGHTRVQEFFFRPSTGPPPSFELSGQLPGPPTGGRRRRQAALGESGEGEFVAVQAVGGVDAQLGKWPWMVLFGRWTDDGLGNWFCGGTLITDRHVLTAAHCLRPEEAGSVGTHIGDNDLNLQFEVEHQVRNVSRVVRHPQYLGSQNDLAVVRLATPVELTEHVSPICLPPAGAEHIGQDVEMAGWGLLEFGGNASDILQEVALRVADPAVCETAYRRVPQFESRFPGGFQGTKVCAESRDGEPRDACRGDSGGPLMVRLADDTYQLVGVVSTGVGCGNPEFPGLYTKVSSYIDWIVSQLT